MKRYILVLAGLLVSAPASPLPPQRKQTQASPQALPCQRQDRQRKVWPQGTALRGCARKLIPDERSSLVDSISFEGAKRDGAPIQGLRIEKGRLVAPSVEPMGWSGIMLQGYSSDGQALEVALCAAEPAAQDPNMVWYSLEVWDAETRSWQNPCIATYLVPTPRALAVQGVWDGNGDHRDAVDRFTFACENGAIAKCMKWGYLPWATKEGRPLQPFHQACTRMARADYCGNGLSHTREDNPIDMYDSLKFLTPETRASSEYDPQLASFEAEWGPDGALCVTHTRDGRELEKALEECPDRFEAGVKDLGNGDLCKVHRKEGGAGQGLLRNRSYDARQTASRKTTP